jgi:hypothetical protein
VPKAARADALYWLPRVRVRMLWRVAAGTKARPPLMFGSGGTALAFNLRILFGAFLVLLGCARPVESEKGGPHDSDKVSTPAWSDSGSSGFQASCRAKEVHGYRRDSGVGDQPEDGRWSTEDEFSGPFIFSFDGETLHVNGESTVRLHWDGVLLSALSAGENEHATSVWTYAVNLGMGEIVGTQVNAHRFAGSGIKARAVQFSCEFRGQE